MCGEKEGKKRGGKGIKGMKKEGEKGSCLLIYLNSSFIHHDGSSVTHSSK